MKTILEYYQEHRTVTSVNHLPYESVPSYTEYTIPLSDNTALIYESFDDDSHNDTHELRILNKYTPVHVGDIHELQLLISFLAHPTASVIAIIKPCKVCSAICSANKLSDQLASV